MELAEAVYKRAAELPTARLKNAPPFPVHSRDAAAGQVIVGGVVSTTLTFVPPSQNSPISS